MLRKLIASEYLTLLICVGYALVLAFWLPDFATTGNWLAILSAMAPLLVVACGQTLVMVTGGIDLSVTSTIAVASVCGASLINEETGRLANTFIATPAAIVAMLLIGGAIGLLNGLVITRLRMPPFIVTLTGMMFFSGLAIWMTQSQPIYGLPDSFLVFGGRTAYAIALAGLVCVSAHLILSRTVLGRWLFAIGHNPRTAEVCGIPVSGVLIMAYVFSGLSAAMASILITGRMETGSPVHWQGNLLDIIGAVVIGGTSLYGGRGKVTWTVFGVLFLALLDNSLNLVNFSYFTIMMVKGGVILAASALDALRARVLSAD
jgi:ribose/xylose/arabinose/galactoside ABC-type transport system permease subunit